MPSGSKYRMCAAEEPVLYATPEQAAPTVGDIFSEFRLGGFAHQFSSSFENDTVDVNGELLFVKPLTSADPWIDALLPRPHIGATLNLGGKTSHAYAGLTWTVPLGEKLFVEGSFGASINNGIDGTARRVHAVEESFSGWLQSPLPRKRDDRLQHQ